MKKKKMVNEDPLKETLRSKAETIVGKMPVSKPDHTTEKANTLMHELEVHQIELEIQNQALRESQHALEVARDLYTDLFDFAPIGYLVLDEKGVIQNINLTASALMGLDRSLIKGKPFSAFMSAGESGTFFLKLREAFKNDFLRPFEIQIKRNGSGTFTSLIHGTVTKNDTGALLCRISMQDITEIRDAELLQQQHQDLLNQKDKIQQYLDLAPVIFLLLDTEYIVQLINKKGRDLLGYENQAIQGEKWLNYIRPVKNEHNSPGTPFYSNHNKNLEQPFFESEVLCGNGEHRLIKWTNTTLKDEYGQIIGTLSAGEDITERKRTEIIKQKYTATLEKTVKERTKELSEALEAEKKINELKSAFITIASHELRTPITIIMSSASLLQKYNEKGQYENQQRLIDRIKVASHQLSTILDDFLSLDKLERGLVRVVKENLNIKDFVQHMLDDMVGILKSGQQIIYAHKGDTHIEQDRKMLYHIIANLLSNAIKYSDADIKIDTLVTKGGLILSVQDHGIGISEEDQAQLFKRFFRAKNVEHLQGTGLGLSIVERYLDLLGGSIDFISSLGHGSTFTIRLPIK